MIGNSVANLNPNNLMMGYLSLVSCLHPYDLFLETLTPFSFPFGVALGVPKTESYPTWLGDTSQWEPSLHLWCMEHPFLLDWPNRSEDSLGFGEACLSPSASWQLRKVCVGGGHTEAGEAKRKVETPEHPTWASQCSYVWACSLLSFREASIIPLFLVRFWIGFLCLEAQSPDEGLHLSLLPSFLVP